MPGAAVRALDLHKAYREAARETRAVNGLFLEVREGEVFGLCGPNGAGKSTTAGILTTRIRPTLGTAEVAGADVVKNPLDVKRKIGVVTQYNTLDRQLTVLENLEFRGRYAGMTGRAAQARARELLAAFHLDDSARAQVHRLSGGQAQRVLIARALVHRPEVLFLDEPTSGLDPQTRVNLWDMLREMRVEGQTIVLTTHYLEEAESLCDRVGIIDHGRLLACAPLDELKSSLGASAVVSMRLAGPDEVEHEVLAHGEIAYDSVLATLVGRVGGMAGVDGAELLDGSLRVRTARPERLLPSLVQEVSAAGLHISDMHVLRPSLESVFLSLTGKEYRE